MPLLKSGGDSPPEPQELRAAQIRMEGDDDDGDALAASSVPRSTNALDQHDERRHHNGQLSSWALEGVRRVRSDQVLRKMHFLTGMAAIGGFLFGYDTGVISGAMLPIRRAFDLTDWQQEVVVSSTVLSAFFSSLVGGSLNHAFGRRYCILMASGIFAAGSMILLVAWNYHTLVFGRIVVGIG